MRLPRIGGFIAVLALSLGAPAGAGAALVDLAAPVSKPEPIFSQPPRAIVVGQFSQLEPGKPLALAATQSSEATSTVRILTTTTPAAWGQFQPGNSIQDVTPSGLLGSDLEVGDVNGDGHLDLAFATGAGAGFTRGNGSGVFGAAEGPTGSPGGVTSGVAFLRLPAQPRPALVASTGSSLYVFANTNSSPPYASASGYAVDAGTTDVAAGDLDGDGDEDLATAATSSQQAIVLLGNAVSFGGQKTAGLLTRPGALTVADLDRNGRAELIVTEPDRGTIGIVSTASLPASLGPVRRVATGNAPNDVVASDLDDDGFPELIVANAGSGTVSIVDSSGATKSFPAGPTPVGIAVGEVTGDTRPDVIVANQSTKRVSVLANLGAPPAPPAPPAGPPAPRALGLKKLKCAPKPKRGEVREIVCTAALRNAGLAKSAKATLSRKGSKRALATATAKPGKKLKLSVKQPLAAGTYLVKLKVTKKTGGALKAQRSLVVGD